MKNYNYYKDRENRNIKRRKKLDRKIKKEIERILADVKKDTEDRVLRFLYKYTDGLSMTYMEANQRILEEDYRRLLKRLKMAGLNALTEEEARQLDRMNITRTMTRYEGLIEEINLYVIQAYGKIQMSLTDHLVEAQKEEIKRQEEDLGIDRHTKEKLEDIAKGIVGGSFYGATFSQRLWAHQTRLKQDLERGIARSIIQGENSKTWARDLKRNLREGVDRAAYVCNRLAITETSLVQGDINHASWEKMGYRKYIYLAEPTACSECAKLDGEVFKLEEAEPGVNRYPMHPFCKCSTSPYTEYGP